jgi:hypothetical protein
MVDPKPKNVLEYRIEQLEIQVAALEKGLLRYDGYVSWGKGALFVVMGLGAIVMWIYEKVFNKVY